MTEELKSQILVWGLLNLDIVSFCVSTNEFLERGVEMFAPRDETPEASLARAEVKSVLTDFLLRVLRDQFRIEKPI